MAPDPVVVRPHNKLGEVLDLFADERIGAVPVVDDEDHLVGILSYVDVLVWLRDASRAQAEQPSAP
jgi:CBS domain-containing protein